MCKLCTAHLSLPKNIRVLSVPQLDFTGWSKAQWLICSPSLRDLDLSWISYWACFCHPVGWWSADPRCFNSPVSVDDKAIAAVALDPALCRAEQEPLIQTWSARFKTPAPFWDHWKLGAIFNMHGFELPPLALPWLVNPRTQINLALLSQFPHFATRPPCPKHVAPPWPPWPSWPSWPRLQGSRREQGDPWSH